MSYVVTLRHYHTELSKADREGKISYDITYIWILIKIIQKNLFIKQKETHRFEAKLMVTIGETNVGMVESEGWE